MLLKGDWIASSPHSEHHCSHRLQHDEYASSLLLRQDARISFDASSETPATESDLLIQAMRLGSGTPVLSEVVAPLCGSSAGICICRLIDIETSSGNQGCNGHIGAINNSSGTCSVFTLLRHLLIKEKGGNA